MISDFQRDEVSPAVWITMTLIPVLVINFLGAGAYGEAEFIFASIKVVTIVGLIVRPSLPHMLHRSNINAHTRFSFYSGSNY